MSGTFQAVTGQIVVNAFDLLGGDSTEAASRGRNFGSVSSWTAWQSTQAAAVGATAAAIPGVHVATLSADIAILMHKMAWCCWGIGGIHGCHVERKTDLALILGLWADAITLSQIEEMLAEGVVIGGALAAAIAVNGAPAVASKLAAKTAKFAATELAQKLGMKSGAKVVGQVSGFIAGRLMEQFATKVSAKIAKMGLARTALGFLPLVGPIVGGTINLCFVSSIAEKADEYYQLKKRS